MRADVIPDCCDVFLGESARFAVVNHLRVIRFSRVFAYFYLLYIYIYRNHSHMNICAIYNMLYRAKF
jgi:hypothetical protein